MSDGGASELWLPVRFRNEKVHVLCKADGELAVGPQGFVDFSYQLGGKRYKSRPENFERIEGAVAKAAAAGPAAGPGAGPAAVSPKAAKPHGARVTGPSAEKKGQGKVVDLAQRRGPDKAIQLWTDGACSGNPGPAGLGVLYEHQGRVRERSEYLGLATNNIAELTAILRGLEMVEDASLPVDVMTDSEYCIGLLGLGWKPKKNQELVESLRAQYARFGDLLLVKVPGHAGVPGNERADELARNAISSRSTTAT
ncbi:MAG: ribonuclease H [Myxococcota bacterium]